MNWGTTLYDGPCDEVTHETWPLRYIKRLISSLIPQPIYKYNYWKSIEPYRNIGIQEYEQEIRTIKPLIMKNAI